MSTTLGGSPYNASTHDIEGKVVVVSNVPPREANYAPSAGSQDLYGFGSLSSNSERVVTRNTVYNGNLTISSSTSLQIINTTYRVNGYVFVYGNLSLVNSTLTTLPPPFEGSLIDPLGIWLFDHANATFFNSTTSSPIGTHNSSSIIVESSNITYITPYAGSGISPTNLDTFGSSKALIDNSIFRWVETWGTSQLTVNKSKVTDIGPLAESVVFVYNSTVREFSAFDNSVSNVYSTSIGYFVETELNATVFLWNSSVLRIDPNPVPSLSVVVIGNGLTVGLVGGRLFSKPPLASGVKDGGATIEIFSDSDVSGELRFYWGVFVSTADTFQRLGLDKEGVRIVSWNGTIWETLQDQGSLDFGQGAGGYFWARFSRAGIYALVGYPVSTPVNVWFLVILPLAGLLVIILWIRRKGATRIASESNGQEKTIKEVTQ